MQKPVIVIVMLLLLVVPTIVMGVLVLNLIEKEQQQLAGSVRAAAMAQASVVVDDLKVTINDVKYELLETLAAIPARGGLEELSRWRAGNPLIRNIFMWQPARGLVFPAPDGYLTREEQGFVRRFQELFSDETQWASLKGDAAMRESDSPASSYEGRLEIRNLAKSRPDPPEGSAKQEQHLRTVRSGWIPWFADNRLHLIGWAETGDKTRYGIEVEMMTLLGRIISILPESPPKGHVVALLDGNGRVFHQVGDAIISDSAERLASAGLSPVLPHWEVAVFRAAETDEGGRTSFVLIVGLMVITAVTAIVFGSIMLLWQLHRQTTENRRKTTFVSNVSHELKTPITTIRMYAELLEEGAIRDGQKQREYLATIARESTRLSRLIANVLDFSRLEAGRKKYSMMEFDVSEALDSIARGQRERLDVAGISLNVSAPEGLIVSTDRDAFEQILLNLIDNAFKYASEGGTIDVKAGPAGDGMLVVSVSDRGPGVDAAHRRNIFQKFYRADDSLTAEHGGSGLGLAIARQMARGLGGDLVYSAREGGGSVFEFSISIRGDKE